MDIADLLSSDSDDIPLALRVKGCGARQASQATSEEPDWVRAYSTVRKATCNESDSDSVANILSSDEAVVGSQESQVVIVSGFEEKKVAGTKKRKAVRKVGAPKSELKLVTAGRLDEGLTLLQSDGTELDLSGDVGAVGRVKLEKGEALLDIKGTLFKALPYRCNTACVMTVTESEARISAMLSEAVTLGVVDNVFAGEESGARDGHLFSYETGVESSEKKEKKSRSKKKKR